MHTHKHNTTMGNYFQLTQSNNKHPSDCNERNNTVIENFDIDHTHCPPVLTYHLVCLDARENARDTGGWRCVAYTYCLSFALITWNQVGADTMLERLQSGNMDTAINQYRRAPNISKRQFLLRKPRYSAWRTVCLSVHSDRPSHAHIASLLLPPVLPR